MSVWLYSLLIVVVALTPDVVIRVVRKHWAVIRLSLHHLGRSVKKKLNRETFLPHTTYYNPAYENRVIGKTIKQNTSIYC